MAKHPPYSRQVLRGLRRDWLRRNRGFFIGAALAAVAMLAGLTAWVAVTASSSRLGWFVLGVSYAGVIATFLHGLHTGFLLTVPDAITQLRGATGEENTRDVLKSAKRRGVVWCWVDSIGLERGDLDHLVVTRRGGVLVIDSKWRNRTDGGDTQVMVAAARTVKRRAEAVTRTLLRAERGTHRARVSSVPVRPVVVIWGAEQRRLPGSFAVIDEIEFVSGRHLRTWLGQLDGEIVTKTAAAQLEALLQDFRRTSNLRSRPPRD
jgi:hypothetical protein